MARAIATDFYHNFRFEVIETGGFLESPVAAFSAITLPEMSVEPAEYREGNVTYTRKYPGIPTAENITFSRGIAKKDTTFLAWIKKCIEGSANYRTDFVIKHKHRDDGFRSYNVKEAFAIRCKFGTDMDATDSGISIAELDIVAEEHDIDLKDEKATT